uniref:Uncharacterized protein n=1 Tax=Equus asinus TaxID=9793 RepID=A0A9L0J379_EQUAS
MTLRTPPSLCPPPASCLLSHGRCPDPAFLCQAGSLVCRAEGCGQPHLLQQLHPILVLATPSAAFGSDFQYGYNMAVVNTLHKALKSFCNKIYFKRHGTFRDEKVVVLLFSCTVSVFPLGRVLGSLTVGLRGALLINSVFTTVPAVLMGVSGMTKPFELITFSRWCWESVTAEGVSYSNLRGTLGAMTKVSVVVGIFLAQISSLQAILGNPTGVPEQKGAYSAHRNLVSIIANKLVVEKGKFIRLASVIGRWRTSVLKNHLTTVQNLETVLQENGQGRRGSGMLIIWCDELQGAILFLSSVTHDGYQHRILLSGRHHVPEELREQSCLITAGDMRKQESQN